MTDDRSHKPRQLKQCKMCSDHGVFENLRHEYEYCACEAGRVCRRLGTLDGVDDDDDEPELN